jgi:hypothetical protein
MTSNINTFISNFRGGARPNRFSVLITWPALVGTPDVRDEVVCEAAQLPSSVMGVVQAPFRGRQIPLPGDRTFEEWTSTFTQDITFSHRNALERWHELMNGYESNVQGTDSYRNLVSTINVSHLDLNDNIIKVYRLFNAWPSNVAAVDLSFDANDQLEKFTTTWSYTHFETV